MRPIIHIDELWLRSMYAEGKSQRAIAAILGVSLTVVRNRMKDYGIARRDQSEATASANRARDWGPSKRKSQVEYQRGLRKRRTEIVQRFRNERGCSECGEKHPATLDLHHINGDPHPSIRPRRKDGTSRSGGNRWAGMSYADIETELTKCIVLCSNCHRIHTWEQRQI